MTTFDDSFLRSVVEAVDGGGAECSVRSVEGTSGVLWSGFIDTATDVPLGRE
jgi:hypothetical protein